MSTPPRRGASQRIRLCAALAFTASVVVSAVSASALAPSITPRVIKTISVGAGPDGISTDGQYVWLALWHDGNGNAVKKIDAETGVVLQSIDVTTAPNQVSADGRYVWVTSIDADLRGHYVTQIETHSGRIMRRIRVGETPFGIYSDQKHVWVSNAFSNTVSEIDATTGAVVNTISVGTTPTGITSDGVHAWVANNYSNTVSEISIATGRVIRTIQVGVGPVGVASDGRHVWVANHGTRGGGHTVSVIDCSTGQVVKTIRVGKGPAGVVTDGSRVWVVNEWSDTVTVINAFLVRVEATVKVGAEPLTASSDGTLVWVTNYGDQYGNGTSITEILSRAIKPWQPTSVSAQPGNRSATVSWYSPFDGGSGITGYRIEKSTDNVMWTVAVANTHSTTTNRVVRGLTNGTTYYLRVLAINAVGRGPASYSTTVLPRTTPSPPLDLVAEPEYLGVNLRWSAPASDGGRPITGYTVQYSEGLPLNWVTRGTTTSLNYSLNLIANGTTFYFRVAAINEAGTGNYSAVRSAIPSRFPPLQPQ